MIRLSVFLSLLLLIPVGFTQTYRWVDENGVVSYSQTPPPNHQAEILNIKSQSKTDGANAQQKLDDLRQRLQEQNKQRQLAKESADKARQEQLTREKNCRSARSNLSKLEGLGTRLLKTPEGDYIRLSEEQRQQRMESARQQIKLNCPP
jgi:parvulin-like peptidyl-prolyl isomerase